MSSEGTTQSSTWTRQHPENWPPEIVVDWVEYAVNHYKFPDDVRRQAKELMRNYSGKKLLSMQLSDFRYQFKEIGELIYTAFQQILDVDVGFEERRKCYAERIKLLIDKHSCEKGLNVLWKSLRIHEWTTVEVQGWLADIAERHHLSIEDSEAMYTEFETVNGRDLLSMNEENFLAQNLKHARLICNVLQDLIKLEQRTTSSTSSTSRQTSCDLEPIKEDS